jgi:hypothetical protein
VFDILAGDRAGPHELGAAVEVILYLVQLSAACDLDLLVGSLGTPALRDYVRTPPDKLRRQAARQQAAAASTRK